MAASNRTAVSEGRDPLAEKQADKEASRNPSPSVLTFAEAATRVIELRRSTWSNPKHAAQWRATLETYAFPVIGHKQVDSITASDSLAVLTPIWTDKPETASRVRQRMETVMDWAVTHGYRLDNPAGRALLKALPQVKRMKRHHLALPYAQVPPALSLVRDSTAHVLTKLDLEFLVLTAARSGEVRRADWGEVNLDARTWEIPVPRMKVCRPHRVLLLSDRAMRILLSAFEISDPKGLIFPSGPDDRAASGMTLTALLCRLDIPAIPRGFCSSFRNWVEERAATPWAVAESALAHNVSNAAEAAYMRSDLFEQRRELMQRWAEYVAGYESNPGD